MSDKIKTQGSHGAEVYNLAKMQVVKFIGQRANFMDPRLARLKIILRKKTDMNIPFMCACGEEKKITPLYLKSEIAALQSQDFADTSPAVVIRVQHRLFVRDPSVVRCDFLGKSRVPEGNTANLVRPTNKTQQSGIKLLLADLVPLEFAEDPNFVVLICRLEPGPRLFNIRNPVAGRRHEAKKNIKGS